MLACEGVPIQYGRGLGGILSGIFRRGILPVAETVGKSLLRTGAKHATGVLKDVSRGSSMKKAMKKQAGEIIPSMIQSAVTQVPATKPTPLKQRRVVKRKRQGRQHPYKKKARQREIFDV